MLAGIDAAQAAGLGVKINMVALKGINDDEFGTMLEWCGARGIDLSLIETMPLGEVEEDRTEHYLPLDAVKGMLERDYSLIPTLFRTGGPSRYYEVAETGSRIGFITPLTNNFCDGLQPHSHHRHRHHLRLPRPRPEGRASRPVPQWRAVRGR